MASDNQASEIVRLRLKLVEAEKELQEKEVNLFFVRIKDLLVY